jgi:hypothetical protein
MRLDRESARFSDHINRDAFLEEIDHLQFPLKRLDLLNRQSYCLSDRPPKKT